MTIYKLMLNLFNINTRTNNMCSSFENHIKNNSIKYRSEYENILYKKQNTFYDENEKRILIQIRFVFALFKNYESSYN